MIALLLSAASFPQNPETVELSRNSDLKGQVVRYFGVEDTTLDPSQPESSQGGIAFLKGGAGRVILIRFGDLRRSIGVTKRIRSATLLLTPTSPTQAKLDKASEVLVEWNEGPAFVVNFGNLNADSGKAPAGTATYRWRSGGTTPEPWKGMGASGLGETKVIPQARMTVLEDGRFSISGIETAIQQTYDSPFEVGGVALQFSAACEFFSAQSPQFSPVLKLELENVAQIPSFDLSVSCIKRSPWPKLPATSGEAAWPNPGDMIEHRAEIRNGGSLPCEGFRYRWKNEGSWGGWVQVSSPIAPGIVKEATISLPFQQPKLGGLQPSISFEVEALQSEANRANNALELPVAGLGIAIQIPREWKGELSPRGTSNAIDTAQALVEFFNRVVFPQSRFSFAPGGVTERLYVFGFDSEASKSSDLSFALQPDWNSNVAKLGTLLSQFPDSTKIENYWPGQFDPFGGISGRGETRFEGAIPRTFFMPREPVHHPLLNIGLAEPTGLMSMSDAFGLNQDLGKRGAQRGTYYQSSPILTIFKALDMTGKPIANAKLSAFRMQDRTPKPEEPFAVIATNSNGEFAMPKQLVDGKPTSHPFGKIFGDGSNCTILLELVPNSNMVSFIKAWQILDLFARAGASPAVFEVRFNATDAPIETSNLATNRIVSMSFPAKISGPELIIDGDYLTGRDLPSEVGSWVEIDLGRDRAIGEVRLGYEARTFWRDFEILGYSTGQKPEEATVWRREKDSVLTAVLWGNLHSEAQAVVPYRAPAQRFRYIRIRNMKPCKTARLNEIQVYGISQGKS